MLQSLGYNSLDMTFLYLLWFKKKKPPQNGHKTFVQLVAPNLKYFHRGFFSNYKECIYRFGNLKKICQTKILHYKINSKSPCLKCYVFSLLQKLLRNFLLAEVTFLKLCSRNRCTVLKRGGVGRHLLPSVTWGAFVPCLFLTRHNRCENFTVLKSKETYAVFKPILSQTHLTKNPFSSGTVQWFVFHLFIGKMLS